MKRIVSLLLTAVLVLTGSMTVLADGTGNVNEYGQAYLVTGADLNNEQYNTVMDLLGVTQEELPDYVQLEVTNGEEHQYLDAYLPASVIGSRAFSSVKLIPQAEGSGLSITTYNINYCTVSMYKNALITAGMEDAEVTVAGPFELSGTAALIGAVKAYADSQGEEVDEEALETATNEIVLTGELGEEMGDAEAVSDLMAYVKQVVVEQGLEDEEDIRAAIEEGAEKLDLELTEEQVEEVAALMKKISKLDIDPDTLKEQAKDIYDKLTDMGFDIGDVDTDGLLAAIKGFFQAIIDFIKGLFG
ncbi:MAG: DUF1002 domain-containing protein [Lachnospiraceae bacterium]